MDPAPPLETLLPGGRLLETDVGACFVLDRVYPLAYRHGQGQLAELETLPWDAAAALGGDGRLAGLSLDELLFLDTETTGLAGAGTLAFMVGVAFFEKGAEAQSSAEASAFVVRQYFLRDHGDEPAMLHLLAELLAERPGLITFNGRSFDLPLLDNRYLMNRLDHLAGDLPGRPHLDLLPPSRRLWRARVGSCALKSLEENVLGLRRTAEDVPGWLIPSLYLDYLRTGDARELLRVFYHNRMDMLSMVTLASQLVRQFARPQAEDHPVDLLSLARWLAALGLAAEAEQILRLAISLDLPLALYHQALHQLGALLKQGGRREEAVLLWQQIAVTAYEDVAAHVELAKHYEWQHQDLAAAREWTQQALALVSRWPAAQASLARGELEHRLARLERKLNQVTE